MRLRLETTLSGVFRDSGLTSFDGTGWDTSNVASLDSMFKDCADLVSCDLSGWDLSNVKTIAALV